MGGAEDVAFVTGASRGIGRRLAAALAADGTSVVGFARPSSDLDAVGEIDGVRAVAVDVAEPDQVAASFGRAIADFGVPSLLVTAAGSTDAVGPVGEAEPDEWWRAVSVDLRGTMLCVRAVLPAMLERRAGRVVTVYGNLGDDGREHVSAFAAAKAGVARLTETLANETVGTGVAVLGMHPGFVRTRMTEYLASSEAGRRWIPEFGTRAVERWSDGTRAVELLRRIAAGDADHLAGRTVHVGDDLDALTDACAADLDVRRLRMRYD